MVNWQKTIILNIVFFSGISWAQTKSSDVVDKFECSESGRYKIVLNGIFKLKARDYYLVSECGEGLYDDEDQKIKGSDYAELLEDCREQLTLKITALLDKNSAELDDFLKDITKTTGEKIKVTSDKEKTVKNFLKAMLAEKTVQMPIRQVLEKPLGNADLFQPASLFLRRNGLFKKNLGVVPDLVGEVLDPKMTFPSIVAVVETDMGEPQMSLSLLGYDKNGDEVVENQKVYPMGVAHMDFPEMTYLKGELTWKGDYTFSCRLTKQ